jgi:hypothetical protein
VRPFRRFHCFLCKLFCGIDPEEPVIVPYAVRHASHDLAGQVMKITKHAENIKNDVNEIDKIMKMIGEFQTRGRK